MRFLFSALKRRIEHKRRKRLKHAIKRRRLQIAVELDAHFGSTVAYGPFTGLRLSANAWWGDADRAGMLLGIYEQEILQALSGLPERYTNFIDVGAADGYYAVGVLVGGLFERVCCYETSETGRRIIRENSTRNDIWDQLTIRGHAGREFLQDFDPDELARSVLLVDIEGAEFDLFDADTLERLQHSIIFIELHPHRVEAGQKKADALKMLARRYFRVTELQTGARDLSVFPELHVYNDSDRWLVCSEGRECLMSWLRLDPVRL